jgi:hypothetical protein
MHADEVLDEFCERGVAVRTRKDPHRDGLEAAQGIPEFHRLEAVASDVQSENVA